ncbi:MAG: MFS transporter [Candidatus Glassbacteria bacterium]|nr:MFS transporter [Candidatus Glassbacteria bacterium]
MSVEITANPLDETASNNGDTANGDYPYERRVIWLTSIGHGMMHVMELIYAGILPLLLLEFDLSLAQAGVLVFPGLVMLGAGSFPAGFLSDRWDSYRIFLLFFFGSALSCLLASISNSVWQLAGSLAALGLFLSLYHPSGLGLISMGVRRKGLVMGIHGIFGSVGLAISPFLAGFLGVRFGWKTAFALPAVLSLLCGVAMLFFPIRIAHHEIDEHGNKVRPTIEASTRRTLLWLYGIMIVLGFVYRGVMTYLPKFIGERFEVESLSAVVAGGLFASIALTIGGLGQMWGGHLSDKVDPFKLYNWVVPVYAPMLLIAAMFGGWPLILGMCIFFFFFFSGQPLENQMLARATPPAWRSTSYGVKFGLNLGVGALAAPVCGWIGDMWGMGWIFYSLALILLLAAAGVFRLRAVHESGSRTALSQG